MNVPYFVSMPRLECYIVSSIFDINRNMRMKLLGDIARTVLYAFYIDRGCFDEKSIGTFAFSNSNFFSFDFTFLRKRGALNERHYTTSDAEGEKICDFIPVHFCMLQL